MEAPPIIPIAAAPPARTWARWWMALPLLVVTFVFFEFNPSQYSFYPRCTLYSTTGILCPGCGAQRCAHELLHGHILAALRDNALLMLFLPLLAFYGWRFVANGFAGRPRPQLNLVPSQLIWFFAVLIVFAVLRNLSFAPFIYLAPP